MHRSLFPALAIAAALSACTPPPASRQAEPGSMPPSDFVSRTGAERVVTRWNREAAAADRAAVEDTVTLLRSAREALGQAQGVDRTMELLERAESRILTRDTEVGAERRPMDEGPQRVIANARRQLTGGNRQETLRLINEAIDLLQQDQPRRRS